MKTALVVLGNIFLYTVMCPLGRCARGQGQMPPLPSLSVRHWFIVIIRASAGQTLSRTNWRHIPRSVAISGFNFNLVKSFLTHSFQVFLLLPLPTCPTTSYSVQRFTQSTSSFRCTCPYQRSLFVVTTDDILSMAGQLYSSYSILYPTESLRTFFVSSHVQPFPVF